MAHLVDRRIPHTCPQGPVPRIYKYVTLHHKRDFAVMINLKILRQDHSRLFRWSLKPMISVLVRDIHGRDTREKRKR